MELLRRQELGSYLNEAGLTGAGVEVGAQAGDFARQVLAQWQGRSLTLIDPWAGQAPSTYLDVTNGSATQQELRRAACKLLAQRDPRVKLLQALSPAAANQFEDQSLDWVYLDGNHSFQA